MTYFPFVKFLEEGVLEKFYKLGKNFSWKLLDHSWLEFHLLPLFRPGSFLTLSISLITLRILLLTLFLASFSWNFYRITITLHLILWSSLRCVVLVTWLCWAHFELYIFLRSSHIFSGMCLIFMGSSYLNWTICSPLACFLSFFFVLCMLDSMISLMLYTFSTILLAVLIGTRQNFFHLSLIIILFQSKLTNGSEIAHICLGTCISCTVCCRWSSLRWSFVDKKSNLGFRLFSGVGNFPSRLHCSDRIGSCEKMHFWKDFRSNSEISFFACLRGATWRCYRPYRGRIVC